MKEDWKYSKLGEICDLYQPKTISGDMLLEDGEYLVYGANGIIGRYDKYNHVESEVLLTCRGATCGSINISEPYSWINGNAMVVHPSNEKELRKDFIRYYLASVDWSKVITGAAQPQITRQSLSPLQVACPPLPEQESIVSELDCLSSIIEKQKQQLKELDNLAQSIFYTTFGDPTSNNFGWKNRRLGEMVNSNMIGLTRSGSEQDASYKYLYFKMNNIGNEGGVDWSKTTRVNACAQEVEKYTLKEGDFLFNTRNSFELVGKTCVYPHIDGEICLFNNNIMRIDFKKEINATYMAYLFQDKYTKNQLDRIKKGTTSVWAIYYKDLEKIDILVPDIALQEEFASKVAAIEKQKEIIKQSIEEVETLFNSRMDYYFN